MSFEEGGMEGDVAMTGERERRGEVRIYLYMHVVELWSAGW